MQDRNRIFPRCRLRALFSLTFALMSFLLTGVGPGALTYKFDICPGFCVVNGDGTGIYRKGQFSGPVVSGSFAGIGWTNSAAIAKRHRVDTSRLVFPPIEKAADDQPAFDFWIIDAWSGQVFGPLDENEFKTKREAVGIPPELGFRPIHDAYRDLRARENRRGLMGLLGLLLVPLIAGFALRLLGRSGRPATSEFMFIARIAIWHFSITLLCWYLSIYQLRGLDGSNPAYGPPVWVAGVSLLLVLVFSFPVAWPAMCMSLSETPTFLVLSAINSIVVAALLRFYQRQTSTG